MRNIQEKYSPSGTQELSWLQKNMTNNGQKNKMHWNAHIKSFQIICNVSTIFLSLLCSRDMSVYQRSINHQAREKHKTYQTVGWSFLGNMSEHFTLIFFFFFSFRNRPEKLLHPIKKKKHKATLSSPVQKIISNENNFFPVMPSDKLTLKMLDHKYDNHNFIWKKKFLLLSLINKKREIIS